MYLSLDVHCDIFKGQPSHDNSVLSCRFRFPARVHRLQRTPVWVSGTQPQLLLENHSLDNKKRRTAVDLCLLPDTGSTRPSEARCISHFQREVGHITCGELPRSRLANNLVLSLEINRHIPKSLLTRILCC